MRLAFRSALAMLACAILSATAAAQYRRTTDLMYTIGPAAQGHDAEDLIRTVVEAERLRSAMRKAIELLQAAAS